MMIWISVGLISISLLLAYLSLGVPGLFFGFISTLVFVFLNTVMFIKVTNWLCGRYVNQSSAFSTIIFSSAISSIPNDLLKLVEDVIFNNGPNSTQNLIDFAETLDGKVKDKKKNEAWRKKPIKEVISYSLINGIDKYIVEDIENIRENYDSALEIIEGPLMDGMETVGDLFGSGKMFLPQVVKSARVMKKAVSYLKPFMEKESKGEIKKRGKIILATVKGDVHDIGKNIVGVVLSCNGYEIIDLGVMVSTDKILSTENTFTSINIPCSYVA
mgnify:CR=1 FL=1